jgi:hypothetical protein
MDAGHRQLAQRWCRSVNLLDFRSSSQQLTLTAITLMLMAVLSLLPLLRLWWYYCRTGVVKTVALIDTGLLLCL